MRFLYHTDRDPRMHQYNLNRTQPVLFAPAALVKAEVFMWLYGGEPVPLKGYKQ